jgi:hypothetical protein
MQAMTEIRNEFSWSESRDEIFQTCLRQYYRNHLQGLAAVLGARINRCNSSSSIP